MEYPSVGKFEGKVFDPRKWRPQTPTTAYMELRDDDAFWAARRVAAFTDEMIRAVVHTGEFSDPAAEKYLADVLIERRDKIKSVYLTAGQSDRQPAARCEGTDVRECRGVWRRREGTCRLPRVVDAFDNATGATKPLAETKSATTTIAPPAGLPSSGFIAVDIAAESDGASDLEAAGARRLPPGRRRAGSWSDSNGCRIASPPRRRADRIEVALQPAQCARPRDVGRSFRTAACASSQAVMQPPRRT